jgi:predicted PurR-regulated permease PerM
MKQQSAFPGSYEKSISAFAVLLATIVLLYLVKDFVVALLLAIVFSSVCQPLYRRILTSVGDRPSLASIATLLGLCLVIFLPALTLTQLLAVDTLAFIERARPIVQQDIKIIESPDFQPPDWLPFRKELTEALPAIRSSAVSLLSHVATFLLAAAKSATLNTLGFVLQLLIMVYAMFFFLRLELGGLPMMLRYTGLPKPTQKNLADRIASVSGSTVRGTLVIGLVQGVLIGLGLYATGFSHIVYWSTLAAVLSVLPAIGVVLIWAPAVVYLFATGDQGAAIGLFLFSAIFTSSADNVLRPILVGRRARIPDAMILVTTLGGLSTIGASAIILGPVIAGVFLTLWEDFRASTVSPDDSTLES